MNLRDQKGQTLLQFAAGFGRTAAVQLLLTAGADVTADADPGHLLTHHFIATDRFINDLCDCLTTL